MYIRIICFDVFVYHIFQWDFIAFIRLLDFALQKNVIKNRHLGFKSNCRSDYSVCKSYFNTHMLHKFQLSIVKEAYRLTFKNILKVIFLINHFQSIH